MAHRLRRGSFGTFLLTKNGACGKLSSLGKLAIPQAPKSANRETNVMKTLVSKFTFAVPEGHPQQGEKIEKAFDYQQVDSEAEALSKIAEKKWNIVDMVNDVLKANARSNAYQAALLPYRPSDVTPDAIKERMIRDYIRLGIPEDTARKQVEALLAAGANAQ